MIKKIALTLLAASLCLEAGCSRPTAEAPIVAASPTPVQMTPTPVAAPSPRPTPTPLTEEERRQQEVAAEAARKEKDAAPLMPELAVPDTAPAIRVPSPSPTSKPSPSPTRKPRR